MLVAQAVGHPQRLDRARERDHRIVRQREEPYRRRCDVRAEAAGLGLVRMGGMLSNCDLAV